MKQVCQVCNNYCELEEGQAGRCRARRNINGKIVSENYGKITSMALDPIEKKPLRRFYPGSQNLSVGSYGCNLNCPFCQNYEISFSNGRDVHIVDVMPQELLKQALALRNKGNIGVAFTYNEPLIGYEYVRDASCLVHEAGMKNVLVTNGAATIETLWQVLPYIDAMNIDLKGFTREYYEMLGGSLGAVKEFIRTAAENCHVELTTLIVPGENDSPREMRELSEWIASVDPEIALHVTRFFPKWKMKDRNATDIGQVYELAEIAQRNLAYVYTGNC